MGSRQVSHDLQSQMLKFTSSFPFSSVKYSSNTRVNLYFLMVSSSINISLPKSFTMIKVSLIITDLSLCDNLIHSLILLLDVPTPLNGTLIFTSLVLINLKSLCFNLNNLSAKLWSIKGPPPLAPVSINPFWFHLNVACSLLTELFRFIENILIFSNLASLFSHGIKLFLSADKHLCSGNLVQSND